MNMILSLVNKISVRMRIRRYLLLLNHSNIQQIHLANCVKQSGINSKRVRISLYTKSFKLGNNFLIDHVTTESGFAPTC